MIRPAPNGPYPNQATGMMSGADKRKATVTGFHDDDTKCARRIHRTRLNPTDRDGKARRESLRRNLTGHASLSEISSLARPDLKKSGTTPHSLKDHTSPVEMTGARAPDPVTGNIITNTPIVNSLPFTGTGSQMRMFAIRAGNGRPVWRSVCLHVARRRQADLTSSKSLPSLPPQPGGGGAELHQKQHKLKKEGKPWIFRKLLGSGRSAAAALSWWRSAPGAMADDKSR